MSCLWITLGGSRSRRARRGWIYVERWTCILSYFSRHEVSDQGAASDWVAHLYSLSLGCSDGSSYKYRSMDTFCVIIDQLSALQVLHNLPQVDFVLRIVVFVFLSPSQNWYPSFIIWSSLFLVKMHWAGSGITGVVRQTDFKLKCRIVEAVSE